MRRRIKSTDNGSDFGQIISHNLISANKPQSAESEKETDDKFVLIVSGEYLSLLVFYFSVEFSPRELRVCTFQLSLSLSVFFVFFRAYIVPS